MWGQLVPALSPRPRGDSWEQLVALGLSASLSQPQGGTASHGDQLVPPPKISPAQEGKGAGVRFGVTVAVPWFPSPFKL